MLSDIEKIPRYFFSMLHGLVTAYLVYLFTDIDISESYFILFLIFCCCINIITVRLFLIVIFSLQYFYLLIARSACSSDDPKIAVFSSKIAAKKSNIASATHINPEEILTQTQGLYLVLCFIAALCSAYWLANAYQFDWAFRLAAPLHWIKPSSRGALDEFLFKECNSRANEADSKCSAITEYMEVWWKTSSTVSAGFISQRPIAYRGKAFVQLSDACQLTVYNGTVSYPEGNLKYAHGVTSYIDLNDPGIMLVQIVHGKNPCEIAAGTASSP